MNVWSYWHCDACGNIIRGDNRTCPCCGRPIPNGVYYLMPDNPEVIKAQSEHRIIIGNPLIRTADIDTYTDDNGIESDVVSEELESDEEQDMMGFDPNYFQTEAKRASERLLKKENDDIATVLLAGAAYNLIASSNTTLKFDDILTAKTEMLENPYGVEPDLVLMSHRSYADLVRDPEFKTYSQSGIAGVVQSGDVGMIVDGMRIEIIPEVGDNVYLIDTSQDPIVLVEKDGVKVESYRLNETREDVLDLTVYEKPAVLRPDAITKITITRNDTLPQRVFPAGWDPLDGYPAR